VVLNAIQTKSACVADCTIGSLDYAGKKRKANKHTDCTNPEQNKN